MAGKNPTRRNPLNIAHRGGADLWPENTLPAFAEAIAGGADGIEFDIQLSADGALMVHHDGRLKADATRLNGQFIEKPTPKLNTLSGAQLRQYDVGTLNANSAYGARRAGRANFDNVTMPTLREVEDLVAEKAKPDFRLYCELKTDLAGDVRQAEKLAEAYLKALETSPVAQNHIVISFDWRCLNRVRRAHPDMAHAYTTMGFHETDPSYKTRQSDTPLAAAIRAASQNGAPWWDGYDWRDMDGATHGEKVLRAIHAANGKGWFGEKSDMSAANIAIAQKWQLTPSAWTVNQPDEMRACAMLGVDAIITDRPDILAEINRSQV